MTPAARKAILEAIAKGTPKRFAATCAGICDRTLNRYLRHGRENKSPTHRQFCLDFKKAEAQSVAERVARLGLAAKKGHWQADCWWLERRYPEEFGLDRREVKTLQKQVSDLISRLEQLTRADLPTPTPDEPDRSGTHAIGSGTPPEAP